MIRKHDLRAVGTRRSVTHRRLTYILCDRESFLSQIELDTLKSYDLIQFTALAQVAVHLKLRLGKQALMLRWRQQLNDERSSHFGYISLADLAGLAGPKTAYCRDQLESS